ncbi:hypothetical protein G432_00590 [Sphingomonas sp. MM-1]|uniref:DUF5681 domain-containing protein n=1 Tax=Sphingomonas sp. MM-1 TaxID=745310 RepID=UPI0002C05756|nr:DUF5681 domain-containing protein [Sphingomonas sp. MM-1]AGH47846.1 hypothetical protein G432_00590 [Sphingomonas sp. MM-1]
MDRHIAPWEQGFQTVTAPPPAPPIAKLPPDPPGNPAWVKGVSGNPAGRPPGRPDKRLLATEEMLTEMRAIVSVLVGKALEGDTNAASIVLAKVLPSVKAQAEKVQFDLDTDAPISDQVASVLDALAGGLLAPDVARLIIDSIARLADVRATEELAARIEALEAASDARG